MFLTKQINTIYENHQKKFSHRYFFSLNIMANLNFNIEQVTLKLKNGELLCQEKSGKSEVWINFDEIVNKEEQPIGFVICKNCSHIFKYDYKTGTSSLKRHKCSSADERQPKITSYWGRKEAPLTVKAVTITKIINLVCKDLRPFGSRF